MDCQSVGPSIGSNPIPAWNLHWNKSKSKTHIIRVVCDDGIKVLPPADLIQVSHESLKPNTDFDIGHVV